MKRCIPDNRPSRATREQRDEYRRLRNAKARAFRLSEKSRRDTDIIEVEAEEIGNDFREDADASTEP